MSSPVIIQRCYHTCGRFHPLTSSSSGSRQYSWLNADMVVTAIAPYILESHGDLRGKGFRDSICTEGHPVKAWSSKRDLAMYSVQVNHKLRCAYEGFQLRHDLQGLPQHSSTSDFFLLFNSLNCAVIHFKNNGKRTTCLTSLLFLCLLEVSRKQ